MKYLIYICVLFILSSYIIEKPFSDSNMTLVKGGEFTLAKNRMDTFLRQNKVFLDDFYISKYETTLEEFSTFVNETGYITQIERSKIAYVYVWDSSLNIYICE